MPDTKRLHEKKKQKTPLPENTVCVPASSPPVTRRKNQPIFDYDKNPVARRLRDEGIREVNEKFAERNRRAANERRQAIEIRRATLVEKNRLAAENEKEREKEQKEKRLRSERAIDNLIESRKRRHVD